MYPPIQNTNTFISIMNTDRNCHDLFVSQEFTRNTMEMEKKLITTMIMITIASNCVTQGKKTSRA